MWKILILCALFAFTGIPGEARAAEQGLTARTCGEMPEKPEFYAAEIG